MRLSIFVENQMLAAVQPKNQLVAVREWSGASGPGLTVGDRPMNSGSYLKILQDNVEVSVQKLQLSRGRIMTRDADPEHTSQSSKERFQ